jgi:hypothetical protein
MKLHKIQEQDNEHFRITYNKELNCFDMLMKQVEYKTTSELLGILSFVHQIGVNCESKLRIGAQIENSVIKQN